MWQKVAKFKGAEYFRKALYVYREIALYLIKHHFFQQFAQQSWQKAYRYTVRTSKGALPLLGSGITLASLQA